MTFCAGFRFYATIKSSIPDSFTRSWNNFANNYRSPSIIESRGVGGGGTLFCSTGVGVRNCNKCHIKSYSVKYVLEIN